MRALSRMSYGSTNVSTTNLSRIESLALDGQCLPKERFASGVTNEMLCLLCDLVSCDPVFILCCPTKYYCFKCLVGDRKDCRTIICPSCQIPQVSKTITRNDTLRNATYALNTIVCEFVSSGCSVYSSVDTINNHVDSCPYQPSPCINAGCNEICLLKDWEWHYKVECPKRQTRCHGSCLSLLHADEIDIHDCDNVIRDFKSYQKEELNLMCRLFNTEDRTEDSTLEDRVYDWHDQREEDRLARSMSAMKHQLVMLNEDDEVHDSLGKVIHHGKWRCSSLDCAIPYEEHDFNREHQDDGKRHIFFWDCCLNDKNVSTSCDVL